jgi:hypothetical protein
MKATPPPVNCVKLSSMFFPLCHSPHYFSPQKMHLYLFPPAGARGAFTFLSQIKEKEKTPLVLMTQPA